MPAPEHRSRRRIFHRRRTRRDSDADAPCAACPHAKGEHMFGFMNVADASPCSQCFCHAYRAGAA